MGRPNDWQEGGSDRISELMRDALTGYKSYGSDLVPNNPTDNRGQEPTDAEKLAIEKLYGLVKGCTLVMLTTGERFWYKGVATWGEEEGEKPCLYAYRYLKCGKTCADVSILNVWRKA